MASTLLGVAANHNFIAKFERSKLQSGEIRAKMDKIKAEAGCRLLCLCILRGRIAGAMSPGQRCARDVF